MDRLRQCLPEMRYLYHHLKPNKRSNYVKYGSVTLVECLTNVALNLMYSNKNGIKLTPLQIQNLRKNKRGIVKLIMSEDVKTKRKILNNKLIEVLLSTLMDIAEDLDFDGQDL